VAIARTAPKTIRQRILSTKVVFGVRIPILATHLGKYKSVEVTNAKIQISSVPSPMDSQSVAFSSFSG
jgi:hypothetical protein